MTKTNTFAHITAIFISLAIVAVLTFLLINNTNQAVGSVVQSGEYQSTSTPAGIGPVAILNSVGGALGSVIVTGTTTGAFTLYDATTTNIALRGNTSTSSITVASFPGGANTGTYTFDSILRNGLIVVFSGTIGSTTITYR